MDSLRKALSIRILKTIEVVTGCEMSGSRGRSSAGLSVRSSCATFPSPDSWICKNAIGTGWVLEDAESAHILLWPGRSLSFFWKDNHRKSTTNERSKTNYQTTHYKQTMDYLSSSAVSLTVAGNTGISPFLTLLLLGVVERADPDLLNMDGFIEKVLSSWIGISVLSVLTG